MYRLQVKFVLYLEINFFISCIILVIVFELFWCQIPCTAVFAQLVCSFNPSGIFGLNSNINKSAIAMLLSDSSSLKQHMTGQHCAVFDMNLF